jgi:signal transduction histidine kinase
LLRLMMPVEAHESLAEPAFPWFASAWREDGTLIAAADLPPDVGWEPEWSRRGGTLWTESRGRYRLAACAEGGSFLVVGAPLVALREAEREVARFHLVAIAVIVPLLVGLLVLLLDRLLRPLASITGTVGRIRAGRFEERVDLASADAEIVGMAATINGMLDRLAEVRDKQARFNADLAHEVLGPVHGILLEADALDEQATAAGAPREAEVFRIEAIRGRARRIEMLCEAILSYSKSLSIAAEQLREVDLEPVVDLAVEQVAQSAAGHGVRIRNDVGSAVVRGQADLLQQVFVNLLANAVGHSPVGAEVCVEAERGPRELRVRVIDRGGGVSPEDVAHVFERFFSRPASGGTAERSHGVGLSLSREIMRSHRGDLTLAPTPGGGATFVATFPEWRDASPAP